MRTDPIRVGAGAAGNSTPLSTVVAPGETILAQEVESQTGMPAQETFVDRVESDLDTGIIRHLALPAGSHPAPPQPVRIPTDKTSPGSPPDEIAGPPSKTGSPIKAPAATRESVEVAAARMRFEELPAKLRETLAKSFAHPDQFWAGLGNTQRQTLATTFNRLDAMGLWKHVARIRGEHAQPEKPVAGKLKVAGNAGGIGFEAHNQKAFVDDLLKSGKFGVDPAIAAKLHPGQTSLREHNTTGGSLHISVGPGNRFDTHVDKVGSVDAPDPKTRGAVFSQPRSLEHHVTEVWPEKIRQYTKIPGIHVGVGPDLADVNRSRTPADDKTPGPTRLKNDDILGSINVKFQIAGKENRSKHTREQDTASLDIEVMKRAVERGAAQVSPDELRRKGVKSTNPQYENAADPAGLASSIAGHVANAAREGRIMAEIQLPSYYNNLSAPERKAIASAIGRMAKAIAAELPADTAGVRSLKISFGNRNEYVSLRD
jgi:hypothetical protein